MGDLIKSDLVVVRRTDFWIEVEIRTDILFPSGSATLSPSAVGIIQRLAKVLAPFNNLIRVEGHTDDRPIKTLAFYSNWELSAARAASVVRVLASDGVGPTRLAVIGYGENRPRASNDYRRRPRSESTRRHGDPLDRCQAGHRSGRFGAGAARQWHGSCTLRISMSRNDVNSTRRSCDALHGA